MSVLGFYISKSSLGLNFPLFYLIFFSTEFSTPHPDMKLILGHCPKYPVCSLQKIVDRVFIIVIFQSYRWFLFHRYESCHMSQT